MKKVGSVIKRMMAAVLALVLMSASAAAYEYPDAVRPGDVIGIPYSEFFNSKGDMLDVPEQFNSTNFAIAVKTISRGANLVKSFKINSRSHELEIRFEDRNQAAPKGPNVIISELAVRAARSIKVGSTTVIRSGATYKYDGELSFRVGFEAIERDMVRDGDTVVLDSGDSQYIHWRQGDSYGTVIVEYGNIAVGRGRVLDNNRVLYGYSDKVDDALLDRNPDAYIQALDMTDNTFPSAMTLMILADPNDYIYENDEGQLRAATGVKWDKDEYAWVAKLTRGKNYIISDKKLRSAPYGAGSLDDAEDTGYVDDNNGYVEDKPESKPSNNYYNPDTGGGSGTAVAISAIVAIFAIAIVSVIMSTLVSLKNIKRETKKFFKKK